MEIKANLPASEKEYKDGNGEGVYVILEGEALDAYNEDRTGGHYKGILDNDSWTYKGLTHGAIVPLEMRGTNRPVVPLDWLQANFETV